MNLKNAIKTIMLTLIAALAINLSAIAAPSASDAAKKLPKDTIFMASIDNTDELLNKFKQTNLWSLYSCPEMQKFIKPAEEKITAAIKENITQAWSEAGLNTKPEDFPWPKGEIIFSLTAKSQMVKKPDMSKLDALMEADDFYFENFDMEKDLPKIEVEELVPSFFVTVEMGTNSAELKKMIKQLLATDDVRELNPRKQRIRGIEFTVLDSQDDTIKEVAFGFDKDTFILGTDLQGLGQLLASSSSSNSLYATKDFQNILKPLGDSDVFAYLNIGKIIQLATNDMEDYEKEEFNTIMDITGFKSVYGLGYAMQIAPNKNLDYSGKALVGINGRPKGVLAMMAPKSISMPTSSYLKKDLTSFVVANYDLSDIFQQINDIAKETQGMDLEPMMQMMMMGTAQNGNEPVNLTKDVINQFKAPIIFTAEETKPYNDPKSQKMLLSIPVKNADTIDAAFAQIHGTMIANGNADLKHEMLNNTIYLLEDFSFNQVINPVSTENTMGGMAIVNNNFLLSSLDVIEQAIRDTRVKAEPISSDNVFAQAKKYLPSQAGLFFYSNDRKDAEAGWDMMKDENSETGMMLSMAKDEIFRELGLNSDIINLSELPDFKTVEKYFGASVGHMKTTNDGIYMEVNAIKIK
ncbi:MAG: hypothetical protein JEZ07_14055 [Phycisphaerae bacterium]|nr:hypothetical protein [Phycisphaerae bacterium]